MSELAFRPRGKKTAVHLSMTPLIDVLFLLIIFFVLTGTFRRMGQLELRLPDSTTATTREEDGAVELALTSSGEVFLDEELLAPGALEGALSELHARAPATRILVNAEARVEHAAVVAALDAVRGAGFAGVGIGTRVIPPDPVVP